MQSARLPFGDDHKVTEAGRDGINRFGIKGPQTFGIRATLPDYAKILGEDLSEYRVGITVRDPFERMVSFDFSPSRLDKRPPVFTEDAFSVAISRLRPLSDFLNVGGQQQAPDCVLRFHRLQEDFETFWGLVALPGPPPRLSRLNTTSGTRSENENVLASVELRRMVEIAFAEDYALIDDLAARPRTAVCSD